MRLYYSNRIFMGFCCVCCEVLYLALFLLHLPAYQTLGLMDVQVSEEGEQDRLRWWLLGGRQAHTSCCASWVGCPRTLMRVSQHKEHPAAPALISLLWHVVGEPPCSPGADRCASVVSCRRVLARACAGTRAPVASRQGWPLAAPG